MCNSISSSDSITIATHSLPLYIATTCQRGCVDGAISIFTLYRQGSCASCASGVAISICPSRFSTHSEKKTRAHPRLYTRSEKKANPGAHSFSVSDAIAFLCALLLIPHESSSRTSRRRVRRSAASGSAAAAAASCCFQIASRTRARRTYTALVTFTCPSSLSLTNDGRRFHSSQHAPAFGTSRQRARRIQLKSANNTRR